MSMSKKDYVNIANVLRVHYPSPKVGQPTFARETEIAKMDGVVQSMMDLMARDDKQFDRNRFLEGAIPNWHKPVWDVKVAPRKGAAVRRA